MVERFIYWLATMGYIGYLPMPGTVASFVSAVILMTISIQMPIIFQLFGVAVIAYGAMRIIDAVLPQFSSTDPSEIVIDEGVGMMVTFVGVHLTYSSVLLGIILFRFFDITKPFGIKKLEQYKGAFGIVSDDVAAGLISNILLLIVCRLWS